MSCLHVALSARNKCQGAGTGRFWRGRAGGVVAVIDAAAISRAVVEIPQMAMESITSK